MILAKIISKKISGARHGFGRKNPGRDRANFRKKTGPIGPFPEKTLPNPAFGRKKPVYKSVFLPEQPAPHPPVSRKRPPPEPEIARQHKSPGQPGKMNRINRWPEPDTGIGPGNRSGEASHGIFRINGPIWRFSDFNFHPQDPAKCFKPRLCPQKKAKH